MRELFVEGEKVLCYHGDLLYEVMKSDSYYYSHITPWRVGVESPVRPNNTNVPICGRMFILSLYLGQMPRVKAAKRRAR